MTEPKDVQYRQIGQHQIFHDLEVAAIRDLTLAAPYEFYWCPNVGAFQTMAETEATVQLEENHGHTFSIVFLDAVKGLSSQYGSDISHEMSRPERSSRFSATLLYLRRMKMLKIGEREEQWHDVTLEIEEKETRR